MPPRKAPPKVTQAFVEKLWEKFSETHPGDRAAFYRAVRRALPQRATRALYCGSYIDLFASTAFQHVTYLDNFKNAIRFFSDEKLIQPIVSTLTGDQEHTFAFVGDSYTSARLPLPEESFDALISLYAGPISAHCSQYVREGGFLVVNPSHGDVAVAALDPSKQWKLVHVVEASGGRCEYSVVSSNLDAYLTPKNAKEAQKTREEIISAQKGVLYEKNAFAYIFQKQAAQTRGKASSCKRRKKS